MQAYDQHLNMILGQVEETVTTVEIDDETYEEIVKVFLKSFALFSLPHLGGCDPKFHHLLHETNTCCSSTLPLVLHIALRLWALCRPTRGLSPTSSCGEMVSFWCLHPSESRDLEGVGHAQHLEKKD